MTGVTTVVTRITSPIPVGETEPVVDRFGSTGTVIEVMGWKVLDFKTERQKAREKEKSQGKKREEAAGDDDRPEVVKHRLEQYHSKTEPLIGYYEERDILSHVRKVGPYLQEKLQALASHPLVGEARGVGLIGAVQLVADKASRAALPMCSRMQIFAPASLWMKRSPNWQPTSLTSLS